MRELVGKKICNHSQDKTLVPHRLTFPRENVNTIQMNVAAAPNFNIFVGSES